MFYASASSGAPATILNAARILMPSGLGGEPMGKDSALRLWLHSADPIAQATLAPLGKWATVIWDAGADYAKLEAGWGRGVRLAAARQPPPTA
eukprot:7017853-Pyramimonas_sp.AAC.1